jgi:hypothetical protein
MAQEYLKYGAMTFVIAFFLMIMGVAVMGVFTRPIQSTIYLVIAILDIPICILLIREFVDAMVHYDPDEESGELGDVGDESGDE